MSISDFNPPNATSSSSFRSTIRPTAVEDSDEDLFTVPDVESAGLKVVGAAAATASASDVQLNAGSGGKPRKSRNLADREHRRLKRLLRNRVSAQQARERKKVYVNDLESRAKGLEDKNSKLEEKISTLINENTMLRKVLMNTRPKVDKESVDPQNDQSGNS